MGLESVLGPLSPIFGLKVALESRFQAPSPESPFQDGSEGWSQGSLKSRSQGPPRVGLRGTQESVSGVL